MNNRTQKMLGLAVFLVGALMNVPANADLSADERKQWCQEKLRRIREIEKKYKVEMDRAEPVYRTGDVNKIASFLKQEDPFVKKMRTDISMFIELTNTQALENFKDNPVCVRSVTAYQPEVEATRSGKTSPLRAIGNYSWVIINCGISPKSGQSLDKGHTNR